MFRMNNTRVRKIGVALALAFVIGILWSSGDASARLRLSKAKPSPRGQANGVAHRVAALEIAVGELTSFSEEATARIMALEGEVADLELEVADLQVRVMALEAAATPEDPAP